MPAPRSLLDASSHTCKRHLLYLLAVILLLLCTVSATAATGADLLRDGNFADVGKAAALWHAVYEKNGAVLPAKAPDGKSGALQLKSAQVVQEVTLPEGLFELTVQARGKGELLLRIKDAGERVQNLGKDWGTYGYLFEAKAGKTAVTIGAAVEGVIAAAAIQPATAAQKTAWSKQQESLRQFGWIAVSAQRPTPGKSALAFDGGVKPLAAMTLCAVLDEPRLNTAHSTNVDRLVLWLGDHGFERLDALRLPVWMSDRIGHGDAYGSVVVLPRGISPVQLLHGPQESKPLWLEYLRAGGRIVHTGDLPFNYAESPSVEAVDTDTGSRGASLLGFHYGWDSPYWGQGGLAATRTSAANEWGIETGDGPVTGFPVEDVSLAFHVFTVPQSGKQGACDWFRNVRPDMPWSGLVKILQEFNGNSDAALRDVWRAAHYVGKPLTIPPIPPIPSATPAKLRILMTAGGMGGRREFVRGEEIKVRVAAVDAIKATTLRIDLLQNDRTLLSQAQPLAGAPQLVIDTAPFADGTYTLRAAALQDGQVVETREEEIGVRCLPPVSFFFEVLYGAGTNPWRVDQEVTDIHDAGMEPEVGPPDAAALDAMVRNHVGFSLRAMPDLLPGKDVAFEKNPAYFRLDNEGKPVGSPYTAGRPSLNISHPEILKNATKTIATQIRAAAALPSFRPYALTNDDFQIYYGWDYSPHVLKAFTADTGLDTPRKMALPPKFGPIPDNNPWVRWFEWTLIHVDGAYNRAETAGALQPRPDVRIGPIPGGMQIPLICMWEPSQYPPYNFGRNGFNLICSYYYNSYWQPVMTDTFWMEIGRMGNRGLPEWNMPDVLFSAGYTRNNFYHYLAGGVRGLVYYMYPARTEYSWPEIRRLGKVVRRIGPVQARLVPARRDIGMLTSFTTNCFDPCHALVQAYGYHNLMQGHFSVEMVSEDELVAGRASRYKAILLYNVKYLRQSAYDALAAHAAKGGLVILDSTVPFDIPGAKRIAVDTGMGAQKTLPVPPAGVHLSTPGIKDYGHVDRVEVIGKAVSQHVKPQFDSSDIRIVASPFEADGVPFTWFVNAQNGKEYTFCRDRMCDGNGRTPARMKELRDWEAAETAQGPYTAPLEFDSLPGVPYDLVGGRKLAVTKTPSGRYAVTVSMERFGGTLVAWLPSEIVSMKLTSPETAAANRPVQVMATLWGQNKPATGTIPVEFILRDPAGKESLLSGVRAAKDGQAAFDWTPAVNDLPGNWTLTATELASGKSAECVIRLTP